MEAYEQRVIDEKDALDTKRSKLSAFFQGALFVTLLAEEKDRLRRQGIIMENYSVILGERIAAF